QAKDEQIIIYKEQSASIMSLAKEMAARPIQNIIDVKVTSKSKSMSESYQSKYDQRNSNNQFVDTAQTGSNSTFNQYNSSEQKKTLAEAASEIQKLLKQLEETNPTATEPEKVAYVNDETTPSFKRRVVGAFQAGGETAIDEFILENKYLKVAKAAIIGWLQPGG
ncbi:MAG: COR domain-containing protein, partial [Nostoc sp.]